MAEPLIVSFAKGELNTFPGYPEGIIDVIPVDMVAAAIIAVAARPRRGTCLQVIRIHQPSPVQKLLNTAMEWFGENRLRCERTPHREHRMEIRWLERTRRTTSSRRQGL